VSGNPDRLDRFVGRSARLLALAGGAALLWLMGFTVYAEIARYLFNAPLLGAHDISRMSLIVLVFCGLAWCGWTNGHIAVDLVGSVLPRAVLRLTDTLMRLGALALVVVMAWRAMEEGLDAQEFGTATNLIQIPHMPFYMVVAFGFAVYAMVLVVQVRHLMRGDHEPPSP